MKHLKRQNMPKNWPVARKGTTFVVRPNFEKDKGLPTLIILRDILKIAKNRKEVKKALYAEDILINGKVAREEKNGAVLFDTISIIPSKKNYKVILDEKGKFALEEIKESESNRKIAKIMDKRTLKGKKVQLNFSDGRNLLYSQKCQVGDSALINLKEKKIEKIIPIKEKTNVLIYSGKHAGKTGIVESIEKEKKMAIVEHGKDKINVLTKQLMAIE
jgi:small subunit ribosomal protein S4e